MQEKILLPKGLSKLITSLVPKVIASLLVVFCTFLFIQIVFAVGTTSVPILEDDTNPARPVISITGQPGDFFAVQSFVGIAQQDTEWEASGSSDFATVIQNILTKVTGYTHGAIPVPASVALVSDDTEECKTGFLQPNITLGGEGTVACGNFNALTYVLPFATARVIVQFNLKENWVLTSVQGENDANLPTRVVKSDGTYTDYNIDGSPDITEENKVAVQSDWTVKFLVSSSPTIIKGYKPTDTKLFLRPTVDLSSGEDYTFSYSLVEDESSLPGTYGTPLAYAVPQAADTTPPTVTGVEITGCTGCLPSSGNNRYANDGDTIEVLITFDETLAFNDNAIAYFLAEPAFSKDITGNTVLATYVIGGDDGTTIEDGDEKLLTINDFTVSGFGDTATPSNKMGTQNWTSFSLNGTSVTIDKTDPTFGTPTFDSALTSGTTPAITTTTLANSGGNPVFSITATDTNAATVKYSTAVGLISSGNTPCASSITKDAAPLISSFESENDGTYQICARATDAAGNTVDEKVRFAKQTTASDFTISLSSNLYENNGSYYLNKVGKDDNAFSLFELSEGFTFSSAVIDGFDATCDATTTFTADVIQNKDSRLSEGEKTICIRGTETASGNIAYGSKNITVDTVTPAAPSISLTTDTSREGLAGGDSDNYTQASNTLTFTGCAEADSTINIYIDGDADPISDTALASGDSCTDGKEYTIDVQKADVSFSARGTLNTIHVTATDDAGNSSETEALSTSENIVSDSRYYSNCNAALINALSHITNGTEPTQYNLNCSTRVGSKNLQGDNRFFAKLTFTRRLTLTSLGDDKMKLRIGDDLYGSESTELSLPVTVESGTTVFIYFIKNGNIQGYLAPDTVVSQIGIGVTIDSGVKTSPVPATTLTSDSGTSGDNKTNSNRPTFTVTNVEKYSVVSTYATKAGTTILISETLQGSTDGNVNVAFGNDVPSYVFNSNDSVSNAVLADGSYVITHHIEDKAGNKTTQSLGNLTITIDTTAPTGHQFDTAGSDAMPTHVNIDNQSAYTLRVENIAADAASLAYTVTDSSNVAVSGTITSFGNGVASKDLDLSTLTDGSLTFSITITDNAENTSQSVTHTVTKDTAAPAAPSIDLDSASDTFREGLAGGDSDNYTQDLSAGLTFIGCAETGSTIKIYIGTSASSISTTTTADGSGCTGGGNEYTITVPQSDTDSSVEGTLNTIQATATDDAGNESEIVEVFDTSSGQNIITNIRGDYGICKWTLSNKVRDCSDRGIYPSSSTLTETIFRLSFKKDYTITESNYPLTINSVLYPVGIYPTPLLVTKGTVILINTTNFKAVVIKAVEEYIQPPTFDVTVDSGVKAPESSVITLASGSDSGTQGDNKTNDTTPGFTIVNVEKNSAVTTYIWVDGNSNNNVERGELTELSKVISGPVDGTTDAVFGNGNAFTDGTYKIRFQIEDKAGNKSGYLGDLTITIDTVAPAAPRIPDLAAEDDSFGKYENEFRVGTDDDNITKKTRDLSFALTPSDGDDIDKHQLLFYELPEGVIATLTPIQNAPADPHTTVSAHIYGSNNLFKDKNTESDGTRDVEAYSTVGINGDEKNIEKDFYFVALQVDDAGNVSDFSEILTLSIDTQAPQPWSEDLNLNPDSDSCRTPETSQCRDKQTSKTDITFISSGKSETTTDLNFGVDYYYILFHQLVEDSVNGFQTVEGDDWFLPSKEGSQTQQITTTPSGNGLNIQIPSVSLGVDRPYNTWYRVGAYVVDYAGNVRAGSDTTNIKVLEAPPIPENIDLSSDDDTAGVADDDNITSDNDVWTISGEFPKTQGEKNFDIETTVTLVQISIGYPTTDGTSNVRTVDIPKPDDGWASTGSGDDTIYQFSEAISLNENGFVGIDGAYEIRARTFNASGEEGASSDALNVTLDTIVPVAEDLLTFKYAYNKIVENNSNTQHTFTASRNDASDVRDIEIVRINDDDTESNIYNEGNYVFNASNIFNGSYTTLGDLPLTIGYKLVDAAGNISDLIILPIVPVEISIYDVEGDATQYVAVDDTSSSTILKKSEGCVSDGYDSYTEGTVVNISEATVCFQSSLTEGRYETNSYQTSSNAESSLIPDFSVVADEDTGVSNNDRITNVVSPDLQGVTLPNTPARVIHDGYQSVYNEVFTGGINALGNNNRHTGYSDSISGTDKTGFGIAPASGTSFTLGEGTSEESNVVIKTITYIFDDTEASVQGIAYQFNIDTYTFFNKKAYIRITNEESGKSYDVKSWTGIGNTGSITGVEFTRIAELKEPIEPGSSITKGQAFFTGQFRVEVFEKAKTEIYNGTADDNGLINIPATELQEGVNNFLGYVTIDGSEIGPTTLPTITLDTKSPAVPEFTPSALLTGTTTKYLNGANIYSTGTPASLGSVTAVTGVSNNYALVDATTECDSSVIDYTEEITNDNAGLIDGDKKICVKNSDIAGNTVYGSTNITVDTTAPEITIIKVGQDSSSNDEFIAVANDLTSTTIQSFQTDEANSAAAENCSAQGYSSSYTSYTGGTISTNNQICFKATDAAGNIGYKNSKRASSLISDFSVVADEDTGVSNNDRITNVVSPDLQGVTLPNTPARVIHQSVYGGVITSGGQTGDNNKHTGYSKNNLRVSNLGEAPGGIISFTLGKGTSEEKNVVIETITYLFNTLTALEINGIAYRFNIGTDAFFEKAYIRITNEESGKSYDVKGWSTSGNFGSTTGVEFTRIAELREPIEPGSSITKGQALFTGKFKVDVFEKNETEVYNGTTDDNGLINIPSTELHEGINTFSGYITIDGSEIGPTTLPTITLDTKSPAISKFTPSALLTGTTTKYLNGANIYSTGTPASLGSVTAVTGVSNNYAIVDATTECDSSVIDYTEEITNDNVGLIDGDKKICVKNSDIAGNTAYSTSNSFLFTVDITTPNITIIKVGNDTFAATVSDLTPTTIQSFQTDKANSAAAENCSAQGYSSSYTSYTGGTISTNNQICFKATDAAGNIGYRNSKRAIEGIASITIDDSAPGTSRDDKRYTKANSVTFKGQTSPNTEVKLYIALEGNTDWSESNALHVLTTNSGTDGSFVSESVSLSSGDYDVAGSIKPSADSPHTTVVKVFDLVIDNSAPVIRITSFTIPAIRVQAEEYVRLSVTGLCGTNTPLSDFLTGSKTITLTSSNGSALEDGFVYNNCAVQAEDYAGNVASTSIGTFTVDTTAPVQTGFPFVQSGVTKRLSFTVTDANELQIINNNAANTRIQNTFTREVAVPSAAEVGTRSTGLFVADLSGNSIELLVRVDNQAPTVSVREQFNVSNKRKPYLEVTVARNQASVFATEEEILTPVFAGKCSDFSVIEGQYISTSNDSADYTITINSPSSETYDDCTIQFTDEAGNLSNAITLDSFRIASSGGSGGGNGSRSIKAPEIVTNGDEVTETPVEEEVVTDKAPALPTTQETLLFTKPLKLGDEEKEVKQLQQFLNNQGFTVTDQGAGSPGQETEYFGPATKRALEQYQEAYKEEILTPLGLSAPTGVLGPATIQHIQEQTEQPIPEEEVIIIQPDRGDTTTGTITMLRKAINALLERITTLRTQKQEDVDERERQVEIEKQAVIETERREEFDRFIDLNIDSAFRYPDSLSAPSIQVSTPPLPIEVPKPAERKVEEKRQPVVQPTQGTILQESTTQSTNLPSRVFSAPEAYFTNGNAPTSSQDDVPQEKDQKVENQQSGGGGFQGSFFPRVEVERDALRFNGEGF